MKKIFLLIIGLTAMSGFVEYSLNLPIKIKVSTCDTDNLRWEQESSSRNKEENCPCCVESQRILKYYVTNISGVVQTIERVEIHGKESILYQENFDCDRFMLEAAEKKCLYIYLPTELGEIATTDFRLGLKVFFAETFDSEIIEEHQLNYVYCE